MEQEEINKRNIPLQYKVPLQGKMNKSINDCINSGWGGKCSNPKEHRQISCNVTEDVIGFADSQWGTMVVWECKECGQKQFFHLREWDSMMRTDYVRMYHEFLTIGKYNF